MEPLRNAVRPPGSQKTHRRHRPAHPALPPEGPHRVECWLPPLHGKAVASEDERALFVLRTRKPASFPCGPYLLVLPPPSAARPGLAACPGVGVSMSPFKDKPDRSYAYSCHTTPKERNHPMHAATTQRMHMRTQLCIQPPGPKRTPPPGFPKGRTGQSWRRAGPPIQGPAPSERPDGRTIRGDQGLLMLEECITSQSEVICAIVSDYSPWCAAPARLQRRPVHSRLRPAAGAPLWPRTLWRPGGKLCEIVYKNKSAESTESSTAYGDSRVFFTVQVDVDWPGRWERRRQLDIHREHRDVAEPALPGIDPRSSISLP